MAVLPAILMLFLFFNLISGYAVVGDEDENKIIWPSTYHYNAEIINFMTTVKQTTEVWYSAKRRRSRIDYNGGTTKKYYIANKRKLYTVYPKIKGIDLTSEWVCISDRRMSKRPLSLMPKLDGLNFTGQTTHLFDNLVEMWTGSNDYEDHRISETTLYVYKTKDGFGVPVQKIFKKFDLERGELISHVVTNYYNYRDNVTKKELTMDDACFYRSELGKDFKTDIEMLHPDLPDDVDVAYDSYSNYHDKVYQEKETEMRKSIFEENWRMVHDHNRKKQGFKLKMTEFSDRTHDELKYLSGTFVSSREIPEVQSFPHTVAEIDDMVKELPENFDLRLEGAVSAVKNQANCGSCWAFATTAAVEGALARSNGDRLLDLSEQSLVDCAWKYKTKGCSGGALDGAMKYVLDNGIPTEMEYGVYTAQGGFCKIRNMTDPYKIKGFAKVTPGNPNALKVALYKYGPVTVAIHASKLMHHYSSGIFYDFTCSNKKPNHGVTVVGYGVHEGEDYWLVKNSWGEAWGEGGFILMSAKDNNCFLLNTPYYPII